MLDSSLSEQCQGLCPNSVHTVACSGVATDCPCCFTGGRFHPVLLFWTKAGISIFPPFYPELTPLPWHKPQRKKVLPEPCSTHACMHTRTQRVPQHGHSDCALVSTLPNSITLVCSTPLIPNPTPPLPCHHYSSTSTDLHVLSRHYLVCQLFLEANS